MRRGVARLITPGTLTEKSLEKSLLIGAEHNYLLCITPKRDELGVALSDISTKKFFSLGACPNIWEPILKKFRLKKS